MGEAKRRICVSGSAHLLARCEARRGEASRSAGDVQLEIGGSAGNVARELGARMQVEFFGGWRPSAMSRMIMEALVKAGVSLHALEDPSWPEAAVSAHYDEGVLTSALASVPAERCEFDEAVARAFLRESDALFLDTDLSEAALSRWAEWGRSEGAEIFAKSVCKEKAPRLAALGGAAKALFLSEGDLEDLRASLFWGEPASREEVARALGSDCAAIGRGRVSIWRRDGRRSELPAPLDIHWAEDRFCALALERMLSGEDLEAACAGALAGLGASRGAGGELSGLLERYDEKANRDALTGIGNRGWSEAALREALKRRGPGAPLGLALFDIDHFKGINDEWGHPAGDEVIRMVAKAAAGAIRERDWVGRWGGEEFVAFLPGAGEQASEEAGERIRQAVEERVRSPRPVTVSVGVAVAREGESFESWWRRADEALYEAKRGGRNRVAAADRAKPEGPGEIGEAGGGDPKAA